MYKQMLMLSMPFPGKCCSPANPPIIEGCFMLLNTELHIKRYNFCVLTTTMDFILF